MRSKGIGGHQRGHAGRSDEWLTPPEILAALGSFDLDPCAPVIRPWDIAAVHYTKVDDGLVTPWDDHARAFVNPPYGEQTRHWLEKTAKHGNGIALVFARTETEWFHTFCWRRGSAMFFFRGRLHFHYVDGTRADGNCGGPSVLVAYGQRNARTLRKLKLPGRFVPL